MVGSDFYTPFLSYLRSVPSAFSTPAVKDPADECEILPVKSRNFPSPAFISRNRFKFDDITTPGLRCEAGGKGTLLVK